MSEPRIRLDLKHAKVLVDFLRGFGFTTPARIRARAALERAVAAHTFCRALAYGERPQTPAARRSGKAAETLAFPKPQPGDRKARKRSAEDEHRERMRVIRAALVARSGNGLCERCHCRPMIDPHHLFGRGKGRPPESERNCVGICRPCHEEIQHPPRPAVAVECWRWAGQHLEELGFGEEAAMAWARMRAIEDRQTVATAGEAVRAAEMMAQAGRGH